MIQKSLIRICNKQISIMVILLFLTISQFMGLIHVSADEMEQIYVNQLIQAREFTDSENLKEALKIYDKLADDTACPVQYHSNHLAINSRLKLLKIESESSTKTINDLKKQIERDLQKLSGIRAYPLSDQATNQYAQFLWDCHRWDELVEYCSGKRLNENNRLLKARALMELHKWNEACKDLKDLYIDYPQAKDREIEQLYRRCLAETDRPFPDLNHKEMFDRARSLDRAGDRHDAETLYDEILIGTKNRALKAKTALYQAKIYSDTRQNQKALQAYDSFLKEFSDHQSTATVFFRKGIIYRRLHDNGSYLETINKIENNHQSSKWWSVSLMGRGDYWRSLGEWQKARNDFHKVRTKSGKNRDMALWKTVWLEYDRGQLKAARDFLKEMDRLYGKTSWKIPVNYWAIRFQQMIDGDKHSKNHLMELQRMAEQYPFTYYGQQAAVLSDFTLNKPERHTGVLDLTEKESSMESVRAARILTQSGYLDRSVEEWTLAARKIRKPSEGFVFHRALTLNQAGDIPQSRLVLHNFYGDRIEQGDVPEAVQKLLYPIPENLLKYYGESAGRVKLDPLFALAVTLQESGFDQRALSHNLAGGLMQVMPELFSRFSKKWEPRPDDDAYQLPEYNIKAGCEYLAWLLNRFDGSKAKALAGYNAGEHRVEQWNKEYPYSDEIWIEHIPFQQTRMFVKHVLENYRNYQRIYGSELSEFKNDD